MRLAIASDTAEPRRRELWSERERFGWRITERLPLEQFVLDRSRNP